MTPQDIAMSVLAGMGVINTFLGVLTFILAREVKHATNSMKDELVAVTRSDARQEGIAKGRAMQVAEDTQSNDVG